MKYKAVDELEHFSFRDAQIKKFEKTDGGLTLVLEAVIVKADNSQNGNYTDSYAATLTMCLVGSNIQKAVREGYKYYDANDVLVEEVPDTPLTEEEIAALLESCEDDYLFDVVRVNDEENRTGHFLYLFGMDAPDQEDEDEVVSYWLQIEFDKSILEWDRYMNRVQNA